MTITRRNFLKKSTLALAGITSLPHFLSAATADRELVGMQLYSVRDDMAKNPKATLQTLSKIGFRKVEHAGYEDRAFYGYKAREFKKLLDDLGLRMLSGHVDMGWKDWDSASSDFTDEWKYLVEDALTAGQQYIITPWIAESIQKDYDKLMPLLELFNKCGVYCQSQGLKFGYHNDFEINYSLKGKKLYDLVLENCDPSAVVQELDIGNLKGEGMSGLEILKKYPNRFELMHVKDEIKSDIGEMNNGYDSTVLGNGLIPIKETVELALTQNTKYFFIEQESYQGKAPLTCARENYEQLRKWGF